VNALLADGGEETLREMAQFTAELPTLKRRAVYNNVRAKWRKMGGDVTGETYRQLCGPDNEEGYRSAMEENTIIKNSKTRAFAPEEVQAMIDRAVAYIADEAVSTSRIKANALRTVEALCLLTGRRKWEIISTLRVRSVEGEPYQARVEGVCKGDEARSFVIPLLAPLETVIAGLVKVRRFEGRIEKGKYTVTSLFGKCVSHTVFRDLYASAAYQRRESQNHFQLQAGPALWRSLALGISLTVSAMCYNSLTTDGGATGLSGDNLDEREQPAVASPDRGSPGYLFEDPL